MRRLQICLLIVLLLLGSGAATAQIDPQGEQHCEQMLEAYVQANSTGNYDTLGRLIRANPNLTKRAFVTCALAWLMSKDQEPEAAALLGRFGTELAAVIESEFGDPVPTQLAYALGNGTPGAEQQLAQYAIAQYPPYQQAFDGVAQAQAPSPPTHGGPSAPPEEIVYYTDNKAKAADQDPRVLELAMPFLCKLTRMNMALAFQDYALIIQEIDSYPQVAASLRQRAVQAGADPNAPVLQTLLTETQASVDLARAVTYAKMGLLKDFDQGVDEALSRDPDPNNHLSLFMTGFQVAQGQRRKAEARRYLEKARGALGSQDPKISPIFRYVVRTAEYQLEKLEKGSLTPDVVKSGFDRSWAELSNYRPLYKMSHDIPWEFGTDATRFWVDELVRLGPEGDRRLRNTGDQLEAWFQAIEQFNALEGYGPQDLVFHGHELQGFIAFLIGITDQALYIVERSPSIREQEKQGFQEFAVLPEVLRSVAKPLSEGVLQRNEPGFPPMDLTTGNIIDELEGRIKIVAALLSQAGLKERATMLQDALQLIVRTNNPVVVVDYTIAVGEAYSTLGLSELAILSWEAAIKVADQLNLVESSLKASSLLAREHGKQNNWKDAADHAEKATEKLEKSVPMMGAAAPEEINEQSDKLATIAAKAAIESNDPTKALAVLTKAKQMKAATVQMGAQKEAAPEIKLVKEKEQQVNVLEQKVQQLEAMPASPTRDTMLAKTQKLLASSKSEFLLKSREIRQKYSDLYTRVLKFDPLNLPDIQRSLPAEAAVVQYFPTEEGTFVFLVTREQFRLRSVPVTKNALERDVLSYLRQARRPQSNLADVEKMSKGLFGSLIAPISEDIKDKSLLVFIPSGRLNQLPFSALIGPDGEPLIASKRILELAKPTDFMRIASTPSRPVKSVVAFANATGDLPAAAKEGERIAALFPESKLFKGSEANKDNFFKFGGKAEVLHLATHGRSDPHNSLNNFLALAKDQKVAQNEIFELGLEDTSIVTLSACDSALSDRADVSYVASLAEAFWIAGSRSVVASLWEVSDESTEILMSEFYTQLKAGKSKAHALQMAQAKVRSIPKYAHPHHWAAFMLFGDWR